MNSIEVILAAIGRCRIARIVPELGVRMSNDCATNEAVDELGVVMLLTVSCARTPEVCRAGSQAADHGRDRRLRTRLLGAIRRGQDAVERVVGGDINLVDDRSGRAAARDVVDGERQRREPRGAVDRRGQCRCGEDHLRADRERGDDGIWPAAGIRVRLHAPVVGLRAAQDADRLTRRAVRAGGDVFLGVRFRANPRQSPPRRYT